MNGDALFAVNARAVVCDYSENRVGPKRFFFGGFEKLTEGVIGVFDGVYAPLFVRIFGDSALRIRVGAMVGYRKHSAEKRFAAVVQLAEFFDATGKEIFVA